MKTNPIMKRVHILLLTMLFGSAFYSCDMKPPAETESEAVPGEKKIQPVKVQDLVYIETSVDQTITATINAFEDTYLSPALQGRIRSVKVDVDDHVTQGQLLVEMDGTQLEQTRLQYQTLKTDLDRMDTLLQYGSITQQAFDQTKAQVESTYLILKNLEENTLLRAPYAGIITGKYYNDGELFSPTPNTPVGKAALVSLIRINPLKVMVNLSEKFLPQVKVGMDAEIVTEVYPGEVVKGKVFRIHPTVNAATRTFTMEIKIPNTDRKIRPGMYARVSLKLGTKEALLVPSIAVMQQPGTNQRFVMIHQNGTAQKVSVKIVERHDDRLEIASSLLKGGEELIVAGQANLEDGDPVNVVVE